MIVSITAPSGVGKSTLMEGIVRHLPDARPLLSVTTRSPRASGEVEGEYEHVSNLEFPHMLAQGVFLWVRHIHGNWYGTRADTVAMALSDKTKLYIPLLTVDVLRELHTYALLRGQKNMLKHIYLRLSDESELRRRLRARGDASEEVTRRIAECRSWNEDARFLGVRLKMIDADWEKDMVLARTLSYIQKVWQKS